MSKQLRDKMVGMALVRAAGDTAEAAQILEMPEHKVRKLARRKGVQEVIEELNKDIEQVCRINKAKVVSSHLDIHAKGMETEQLGVANTALNSVSKLMGYDAPQKVDVQVDLSVWLTQQATQLIDTEIEDA